jgi:hypothetical protein
VNGVRSWIYWSAFPAPGATHARFIGRGAAAALHSPRPTHLRQKSAPPKRGNSPLQGDGGVESTIAAHQFAWLRLVPGKKKCSIDRRRRQHGAVLRRADRHQGGAPVTPNQKRPSSVLFAGRAGASSSFMTACIHSRVAFHAVRGCRRGWRASRNPARSLQIRLTLLSGAKTPEHREMLLNMAEPWEAWAPATRTFLT